MIVIINGLHHETDQGTASRKTREEGNEKSKYRVKAGDVETKDVEKQG